MKESLEDCCSFTDSVTSSAVLLADSGLAEWWEGRCTCPVYTMIADSFFSLHSFWLLIIVFNAKTKISSHQTRDRILYEDKATLSWIGRLCCWAEALYESFYIPYETGQTLLKIATLLVCAGNKAGILSVTSCK